MNQNFLLGCRWKAVGHLLHKIVLNKRKKKYFNFKIFAINKIELPLLSDLNWDKRKQWLSFWKDNKSIIIFYINLNDICVFCAIKKVQKYLQARSLGLVVKVDDSYVRISPLYNILFGLKQWTENKYPKYFLYSIFTHITKVPKYKIRQKLFRFAKN
jgi:hypothetical protein